MYKEERDMLEDMTRIDVSDMEQFGTLDSSEITTAILGDRRWTQMAKQEGSKVSGRFLRNVGENEMSAEMLEAPLLRVGTVLRLERCEWSMANQNEYAVPAPSLKNRLPQFCTGTCAYRPYH